MTIVSGVVKSIVGVIVNPVVGVIGGSSQALKAIAGWTGLENCAVAVATIPLSIQNGDFAGAIQAPWIDQDVGTLTFEVFDTKTTLKMESGGTYTMVKQAVDVTIGHEYTISVELHNNNITNASEVFIFDGDLEGVPIDNSHSGQLLEIVQPPASTSWQVVNISFTATQNRVTICLAGGGVEIGRFHEVIAL